MSKKEFKFKAEEIKPLVSEKLGGCIATDRIVVDGLKVGYMYRDAPHNPMDSGWRFMAGDESEDYMNTSTYHDIYAVNTIANYDPEIIPFLDSPEGSAFERGENDEGFVAIT